jgi:murein DD-endopeptidase MepM/ murein hydrolase activator NlpD
MGSYNSQYENYYSSLVNKRKSYGGYSYNKNTSSKFNGNFVLKRLTRELIGVFILFLFVIGCKTIVTPETTSTYKYFKEVLNKNYDYKLILSNIQNMDVKTAEEKTMDWMENIKSKITGGKTLKDKLKTNFLLPVEGNIVSAFGEASSINKNEKEVNQGINIDVKDGQEVISPYEGKVKDCGENNELGKFIVIDHGSGIETKYGHLSDIVVKKDSMLKKGEVIGKAGNNGKPSVPGLYFELLYMGENKNPEEYLSFNKT